MKWHGQGLLKSKYFIIFWTFLCKHFYYIAEFGKKIQILQICNFSADSKSKAKKSFPYDVSLVIFRHQTWDLEGGDSGKYCRGKN